MQAGRALKALRTFHRLSLSEAARELSYAKSFISALEKDQKSPSLEALERYSRTFNIPVSSIMLLAESNAADVSSVKARVKAIVTTRLLEVLELMSPKETEL